MKKLYNRFLKSVCCILTAIVSLSFVGCKDQKGEGKPTKVAMVRAAGSCAFVSNTDGAPYKIQGLDITSNDNVFTFENYVADKNGTKYEITNKKGKTIGTICLSSKAQSEEGKMTVDLPTYDQNILRIPQNVNAVTINGNGTAKELYMHVETRQAPLDIYLNDVNIYTEYSMPVLFSYSPCDINIIVSGENTLTAGNSDPLAENLQALMDNKERDELILDVTSSFVMHYHCSAKLQPTVILGETVDGLINGRLDQRLQEWCNAWCERLAADISCLDSLFTWLYDTVTDRAGVQGHQGASAVQTFGNVAVYGSGSLKIAAGNGGNGTDGKGFGGLIDASGGVGGDAGHAVSCQTFISSLTDERLSLIDGKAGEGGYGYQAYETERSKAANGKPRNVIDAMFYCYS